MQMLRGSDAWSKAEGSYASIVSIRVESLIRTVFTPTNRNVGGSRRQFFRLSLKCRSHVRRAVAMENAILIRH
jgi:hypothetical protein